MKYPTYEYKKEKIKKRKLKNFRRVFGDCEIHSVTLANARLRKVILRFMHIVNDFIPRNWFAFLGATNAKSAFGKADVL